VSQDIEDTSGAPPTAVNWLVRRFWDVESPARHHRRHRREAPGKRGREVLRGRPLLGLQENLILAIGPDTALATTITVRRSLGRSQK
jgi:hypothetical protein